MRNAPYPQLPLANICKAACIAAATALGLVSGPVEATAIYSSAAASTFTLTPIDPVTSISDHLPSTPTTTAGTGVASIDTFTASADGVHPATISSAVSGSAVAPPSSSSMAEAQRGHVFVVPRMSSSGPLPSVTMSFRFDISWATHLSADNPAAEFASGGAFFGISGFEAGIDSIVLDAGMPGTIVTVGDLTRWEYNPRYSTSGGSPVDEVHADVITGMITVESGRIGEFSVITDAAGLAAARPVPIPPSWTLLPLGLLAWRLPPRSRRQR